MQNGFEDMWIIERREEATHIEMNIIHEQAALAEYARAAWAQYFEDEHQSWLEDIQEEAADMLLIRSEWKSLYELIRVRGCEIIFAPFLEITTIKITYGPDHLFFAPNLDGLIAAKKWIDGIFMNSAEL